MYFEIKYNPKRGILLRILNVQDFAEPILNFYIRLNKIIQNMNLSQSYTLNFGTIFLSKESKLWYGTL